MPSGRAGEELLEGWLVATTKGVDNQVYQSTAHLGIGKGRFFDVLKEGIAHESKVGYVTLSDAIRTQIRKDAALVLDASDEAADIVGVHWHFFASSASDSLGPRPGVLQELRNFNIPFTIHLP